MTFIWLPGMSAGTYAGVRPTPEEFSGGTFATENLLGRKFLQHHPIFHDLMGKETFYIPDFHRQQEDTLRTIILNHLRITVVRFSNEQVKNQIEDVLGDIAARLRSGSQETSLPLLFPEEKGARGDELCQRPSHP